MKRRLGLLLLLLTGLAFSAVASAATAIPIQTWKTANGVPVYFVKRTRLPFADINIIFHAGSAYDGQHYGLANLVASALDTGTAQLGEKQIATAFANVGAQYGVTVGRDMAVISLRSLTAQQRLLPAVTMLNKLLANASFPQAPWQRLQKQALVGIKVAQQDPSVVAIQRLYQAVYGKQPYSHPVQGTLSSVPALTREQAIAFDHQYYVANNAMLVIVGDMSRADAKHIANLLVAGLPAGKQAAAIPKVTLATRSQQVNVPMPSQQTTILLGQTGVKVGDPRYFALQLGNYILGGGGIGSKLNVTIRREGGLTYGASSAFVNTQQPGLFIISTQTRTAEAANALAQLKTVLDDYLRTGPTQTELQRAKQALSGQFLLTLTSNANIANALTLIAFYHLPLNYLNTYQQRLDAMTLAQVKQAFAQVVHPSRMVTVLVGNNV